MEGAAEGMTLEHVEQVIEQSGVIFPPWIYRNPSNEGHLMKYGVGEEVHTNKRRLVSCIPL